MGSKTVRSGRYAALALAAFLSTSGPVAAQSLDGPGTVATGLLLRQMDGVKRVLMIGAHPDDEDTGLLTALARGWGAETAYLSLTRGDGGQNLIGPELWEGLGIIRTGELEAARRLDGGKQFFTRAFDYGYSKSAEEALSLWPREELLRDVVWIIRTFRPQVVVSVWSGTPRDGHGQHQASGIIAREAFEVAGDASRFPGQLDGGVEAWAPAKLFLTARRGFGPQGPGDASEIEIGTGRLDPLLGRSYYQLSMDSRSQHRSQDMGSPQPMGPRETGVALLESRVPDSGAPGIFSGVDTALVDVAEGLPAPARGEVRAHLEAYREVLARARGEVGLDPGGVAPLLAEGLAHLRAAGRAAGAGAPVELTRVLDQRVRLATRAYLSAAGLVVDVRSEDDLVVPGQEVEVQVTVWNGGDLPARGVDVFLAAPHEWSVREVGRGGTGADVAPGTLATWTYAVAIPEDAEPSRLYYLREARAGAMYRWPDDDALRGLPRDPAPVRGVVALEADAAGDLVRLETDAEWRYVGVDPALGEFEEPVLIVPALSVRAAPERMVWPVGRVGARPVSVQLRSESRNEVRGRVVLEVPEGWRASPAEAVFALEGEGAERTVAFELAPTGPLRPGEQVVRAVARAETGERYETSVSLIDYPHVERAAMFTPAGVRIGVVPVRVAEGLRVGYVMGSGDDGPEAIRQMGAEVALLGEAAVRDGAYDGLDVVVLGVRAFETREDLQAASAQLLDFARRGGTVIAQYNRGPLDGLAPYPIEIGRGSPRVADETAPVRLLDPDAPVFTTPNRITDEDFEGWVQERGLYFAGEWDPAYRPLIEMNDPGEDPAHGSLLVTPVGEGLFVYTALSFFRQWSEGVPGAYRLFANLLSLDGAAWAAFADRAQR